MVQMTHRVTEVYEQDWDDGICTTLPLLNYDHFPFVFNPSVQFLYEWVFHPP